MLVKEIFEPDEPEIQLSKPFNIAKFNQAREKRFFSDAPLTGGGMYASGFPSKTDPTEFVKVSHSPTILSQDAYYNYIQTIKNSIGTNPYFPYIRTVAVGRDPTGMAKTYYKMPTLLHYYNPNINRGMLQVLASKIFPLAAGMFQTKVWQRNVQNLTRDEQKQEIWLNAIVNPLKDVANQIKDLYEKTWRYNYEKFNQKKTSGETIDQFKSEFSQWFVNWAKQQKWPTNDTELIEALAIIVSLAELKKFKFDIVADNLMIRLIPQGPQLVLNDPIHDNLLSIVK
jgi:hypothetical protein